MHFLIIFAGFTFGENCPSGCECPNPRMTVCYGNAAATEFPDISHMPEVEELILVENSVSELPRLSHLLPRLRILNLSHNCLSKISRGSLPMSIEDAWMDFNNIQTLSARIFSNLPNIMRIYLRNVSLKNFIINYYQYYYRIIIIILIVIIINLFRTRFP